MGLSDEKSQKFVEILDDQQRMRLVTEEEFIKEIYETRDAIKNFVTKEDFLKEILLMKDEIVLLREDVSLIKEQMKNFVTKEEFLKENSLIRNEMALIRQEMTKLETRIIKWNVGTMIAIAAIVTGIVKFA